MDFQEALSAVCGRLARLGDGVHVLAPPGSGRRGLARCLAGRGLKVFAPRGYGVEAVEEYGGVEDLARRLEGAGEPVFVVVGSSWEAVKLAEKTSLSGRLRLVYLPALYGELLVEGRRRRLAWVSHDRLCAAYEGRVVGGACEGPAPGLLSLPLEELEAGIEALEALRRSHKNLGEAALRLLLDVAGIVGPLGGAAAAVKAAYEFFQAAIRQRYGEVAGLLKFVEAAEKARAYVRRPEFEALVDSVALEWGMETGRFKILVEALGDPSLVDWLAHGRHVESLGKFGEVYARYNAEELGVTEEYVIEAGVRYPLARGVFVEKAGEVMRLLGNNKAAALVGPRGVGKSTLAKYVAYRMLVEGQVDYVVVAEGPVNANELLKTVASLPRRVLLLFDVHSREVYTPRFLLGAAEGAEKPLDAAAMAIRSLLAAAELDSVGRLRVLVTASDDELKTLGVALDSVAVYRVDLSDVGFLADIVRSYVGEHAESCQGVENLARTIKERHPGGAYTLVAKYAGLWLRESGCGAGDVEEAAKKEPKLFLAHYIWYVLLRGSGDLARKAAVPLLLHAYFGPVPVGVTYVSKAVNDKGIWRLLRPEELEGVTLEALREEDLEPIARWLTLMHEDLVEETLRDLAGIRGEEERGPYKEKLGRLTEALDWGLYSVLDWFRDFIAEWGMPKEEVMLDVLRNLPAKVLNQIPTDVLTIIRNLISIWLNISREYISNIQIILVNIFALFVNKRVTAIFKVGNVRGCWRRAALIAGYALTQHVALPMRKELPKDVAEALGKALDPCDAVDAYLVADGKISMASASVMTYPYPMALFAEDRSFARESIREFSVLYRFADVQTVRNAKEVVERLVEKWGKRGFASPETLYALGLAAIAAEAEIDEKVAELLLYASHFAVQWVVSPTAVLPILATLRPLGEKAPHGYVALLAAASELDMLDRGDVSYIYNVLNRLKGRLPEGDRLWPLVEAIRTYSNLLIKHEEHIDVREVIEDICALYGEVRKKHDVLEAVAKAYVLAAALRHDDLTSSVQEHCGLGDPAAEAEEVKNWLNALAGEEGLKRMRRRMKRDKELREWVATWNTTKDVMWLIKELRGWFTSELARYRRDYVVERDRVNEGRIEEVAEMFNAAADIRRESEDWANYLTNRGHSLRTRIVAASNLADLLKTAREFGELRKEAEKHFELTAGYLEATSAILGNYLAYLVVFGERGRAEELLKEQQFLLDLIPQISATTKLVLRLFGMGKGVELEEIVEAFWQLFEPEFRPALLTLAGRLQRDDALRECAEDKICSDAVKAIAGDREATERLKSIIEGKAPEAHQLLANTSYRVLVEVLAPKLSSAQFALMLLAALEGRSEAVRLHGLWGSVRTGRPLPQRLFRDVYENCGDLNSEGCKLALLKLYYYHY